MNDIINLPTLISKLSQEAGVTPADARRFIHELFAEIETRLSEGSNVDIDYLGKFFLTGDQANPVAFKAEATLADKVNEPFSAFKAVELNDGAENEISGDSLSTIQPKEPHESHTNEEITPIETLIEETLPINKNEKVLEDETSQELEDVVYPTEDEPQSVENKHENHQGLTEIPSTSSIEEPILEDKEDTLHEIDRREDPSEHFPAVQSKSKTDNMLWLVMGVFIGIIIGLVGGFFAGKSMAKYSMPYYEDELFESEQNEEDDTIPDEIQPLIFNTQSAESKQDNEHSTANGVGTPTETTKESVSEQPKKVEPVYDNVTSTLAQLAKKHYGVKNYWVFIYNANKQLTNPNRISPGTRVIIPPYESFAGATKAETEAKAQALMNEISKKYKI